MHACLSILTYTLLRRIYICMCINYLICIAIMSNICDSTDTSTYYVMVKYTRLSIVSMIDACIFILQEFYIISHTEPLSVTIIGI